MQVELIQPGSYCAAKIFLKNGEFVRAQSDAMVAMTSAIEVEGKAEGGIGGMFKRMFTGESLFIQTLKATSGDGEVIVAPGEPGDITVIELNGDGYILQKGAFLAADPGVELSATSQGVMKGLFSGEGFFLQTAKGKGTLLISSFGGIVKKTLSPGENWIVDNGHLVAWSDTIQYSMRKASKGIISSLTSGEGLVCDVQGPGDVYIQTRNPSSFGQWVRQFIPVSK